MTTKLKELEAERTRLMDQVRALRQPFLQEGPQTMPEDQWTEQEQLISQVETLDAEIDTAQTQQRAAQERTAAETRFTALEQREQELDYPAPLPQPKSQQRQQAQQGQQLDSLMDGRDQNGFRWEGPLSEQERIRYRNNWGRNQVQLRNMRQQDRSGIDQKRLLRSFMDYGLLGMNAFRVRGEQGREELRAFQIDLDVAGGYLRPPDAMSADVIQGVDDMVYIRQLAKVTPVRIGQEYTARVRHQRQDDANWTTELQEIIRDESVEYGSYTWRPHRLTKLLLVSRDLFQMDSDIFMQEFSSEAMYAFDVTQEKAFLTGTGAGQPQGVLVTGPDDGPISSDRVSSKDNSTTAVTYDGLVNAEFELKVPHRRMSSWMFHRYGVRRLYQVKDNDGRPYLRNALERRRNRHDGRPAGHGIGVHAQHVHHQENRRPDRQLVPLPHRRKPHLRSTGPGPTVGAAEHGRLPVQMVSRRQARSQRSLRAHRADVKAVVSG